MIAYGKAPEVLGVFNPSVREFMFYLYLPIKFPYMTELALPTRLEKFRPMIREAMFHSRGCHEKYIYLTAKTLPVEPGSPGNRPGWHADGFNSDGDLNFVWANMNPTQFAVQDFPEPIGQDDRQSMLDMAKQIDPSKIRTYPDKSLLKLDESVVHRVNPEVSRGFRTFVKITISHHRFLGAGNSHNHLLDYDWEIKSRSMERNLDHG